MADLYDKSVLIGQQERQQFTAPQTGQPARGATAPAMSQQASEYLDSLDPSERQAAMERMQAPLNGEDIAEALKRDPDFIPTHPEYLQYVAYNKTHESSIIDGISEGAGAVLNDLGAAVSAVADHPMKALAKAPTSLIEAFAQGTRNLYGMVAQSANPDSILFGFKNAIAGDGSPEGYNQFLQARKFNKHSARLASGEDTIIMDKDVIDHDMTLAMSYIADPTLFIPFGAAATAGMKAVGLGEKMVMLGGRASALKAAVIGGGLKWGIGAPIEFIGGTTRAVIDRAVAVGGNVLETATGMPAAELRATARLSAVGTTTADLLGGHIPVVSNISNVYLGAGAAAGIGETIGAVGEQIMKQGGKRGNLSFARAALEGTPNLSSHARGLLKVLDAVDPLMSYGYSMAEGMGHGAAIGGTLGYLSGGEEGFGHGIGAGMALGGTGALAGRAFAEISGGTRLARAEVQGEFNLAIMKANGDPNYKGFSALLLDSTLKGDRAGALQAIGGLDRVAPNLRMIVGSTADAIALLKEHGLNKDGHKINKDTGHLVLDAEGNPVKYGASVADWHGGEGFVMFTDMDASGKKQVTIHINTDASRKTTLHHEIFHAAFRSSVMETFFKDGFSHAILGKYDETGKQVKPADISPAEFRKFVTRELRFTRDANGNQLPAVEVHKRLKQFDAHLAEYQKVGGRAKMNPESARALDGMVEEFGAHYFTQFLKGKSVDYLFHGAEFSGMRGVVDRLHNNFLDFWQTNVSKQRPTFDFSKGFDTAFGTEGKRTMAQRVSSIDYLAQDMLRANAGKRKGSSNSVDVRTLTPEARTAFFEGNGIDGLKHFYDKFGNPRNLTEAQVKQERLEVGKAVHEALSKLDPKDTAGLIDVDGNFGASSTLGTRFNDTMLAHLVKEGHITQLLADRIKAVQDIVSGKGSNVVSYLYHGESQETQVGPNSPRRYGADVPITARNTIVVGYDIKVKKDGTMSLVMKGLDKNIIDARGNALWSDPKVRDLWQGDRNAFDQSFFDYLSNASKASTDNSRVESALIPSLARGDGFGGERRNVMHQFLGLAKRKSESYFNTPIAEIPRGKTSTLFNSSMDLMTPMESNLPTRYDFNLDNAQRDLSKNFKVSDMEAEKTPVGNIFTHASGYKITSDANGAAHLYDSNGKSLGAFKDKDLAGVAMEKAYAAERVEVDKRIERVKESQDKQQAQFKVWDDETLAKGRALGDIFETDAGKAFHQGTTLIRQTREEFFSDNFIKLRQSDPETVMQITEQIAKRGYALRDLRTKAYDRVQAELAKGRGKEYGKARNEYDVIVAHADRYNDILLAYERATKRGRNGQAILDYINTHRRTSTGYDNMAKIFFGDAYDSQFQTGKPVTTVATHGTNSNELLTSRQFDPAELGSRHGSDKDKVGVFLSGETKTSMGYADPKTGDVGYRQVRAAIKFNNPFVVDFNYDCFAEYKYEKIFNQAKAGGHDGVIIKNVYDGGSADTVFVVMADKIKDNTAIIDTHLGMDKVDTELRGLLEYDQGAVRYPIQETMPRGKDVRVGTGIGLSWKVADGVARESGFDKFLEQAGRSGRLRKGVNSEEFAGRPVVLINYDNSGVWNLIDSTTGEVISTIQGGALHNVISGKINPDKQAAVLASVNSAGLKGIEAVRQKAIKSGKPLTFLIISGNETKSFSHPQVGSAVTSLLAKFLQSKAIDPAEINTLIKAMSEAFSTKSVKNKDGTTSQIRVPQGDLLKPLIGRPAAEQIAFLEKQFFPQDKSTFNNRGETMDRLVQTIATLPSVIKNKDYFQKFFNNPEMKMTGKDFQREFLKLTDEPITRTMGGKGESLGYGKIVAALEVPQGQPIVTKGGGHEGFPMDYRSDAGKGKNTPAVMSVFEVPRRITDMVSPPHGRDVNPHYISKSGKIRSSSELIMNTTSTFGEGVVRESSHDMRKDNLSKATTKEKTLAGKPAFKVSDEQMSSAFIGRVAKENPNIIKGIRVEFDKTRSSKFGEEYLLRLFKKDKADGGEEVLIGTFNSEVDGNSASSGNAEIKGDFRNKGYGRLMYSEMAERLRALGAESWGGRMVDQARRPQTLRERVIDKENARLGYQDSETRLSDERQDYNGDKTFYIESTLRKEAHYKVSDSEGTPNLKPFEGNFKVSDVVKKGVDSLGRFVDENADTANISPTIKTAMKALREAIAKQEATDEVLVPELREAYDTIVASVEEGISRPALTPVETLKELQKILKPLDKKIDKNSERIQKNSRDAVDKDMAEGSDLESDQNSQRQGEYNQSQNEGADLESEQAISQRGDYTEDMNDGAGIEADQPRNQNLPPQFPYPAPETPAGLPSYKPSGTPAFPRPPARPATPRVKPSGKPAFPRPPTTPDLPRPTPSGKPAFPSPPSTPALPQVTPNNKPAFPRPPTAPAVPRGSIAPPPPRGSLPDSTFPNLPPSKPVGKLEGWRGWTLEKGLNGGFWKNAVGWMIVVQGDKFKVYNPEKAMLGIYQDLDQAKRRVQRAEPKQ